MKKYSLLILIIFILPLFGGTVINSVECRVYGYGNETPLSKWEYGKKQELNPELEKYPADGAYRIWVETSAHPDEKDMLVHLHVREGDMPAAMISSKVVKSWAFFSFPIDAIKDFKNPVFMVTLTKRESPRPDGDEIPMDNSPFLRLLPKGGIVLMSEDEKPEFDYRYTKKPRGIAFVADTIDLGEIDFRGGQVPFAWRMKNTSSETRSIDIVRATCLCTTVIGPNTPFIIEPGQEIDISALFSPVEYQNRKIHKSVGIMSDLGKSYMVYFVGKVSE